MECLGAFLSAHATLTTPCGLARFAFSSLAGLLMVPATFHLSKHPFTRRETAQFADGAIQTPIVYFHLEVSPLNGLMDVLSAPVVSLPLMITLHIYCPLPSLILNRSSRSASSSQARASAPANFNSLKSGFDSPSRPLCQGADHSRLGDGALQKKKKKCRDNGVLDKKKKKNEEKTQQRSGLFR